MLTLPLGNFPSYCCGTLYGSCDDTEKSVAMNGCLCIPSSRLKYWKNGSSQIPHTPSKSLSLLYSVFPKYLSNPRMFENPRNPIEPLGAPWKKDVVYPMLFSVDTSDSIFCFG